MILTRVDGKGNLKEETKLNVEAGSIIPVNGKYEHQTFNTGDTKLHFTMIYDNIGKPTGDEENTEGKKKIGE
jgi:oxalate decarboxylase/phosphoglucose isomerase-like protein (cupin superfamily)